MDIRKAIALVMITTGLVIAPFVAFAAVDSDWEIGGWFDDRDHRWTDGSQIRVDGSWHNGDFDLDHFDHFDHSAYFDDFDIDIDWDKDFEIDIDWESDGEHPWDRNGTWQSDDGDWNISWEDGSINVDFNS